MYNINSGGNIWTTTHQNMGYSTQSLSGGDGGTQPPTSVIGLPFQPYPTVPFEHYQQVMII